MVVIKPRQTRHKRTDRTRGGVGEGRGGPMAGGEGAEKGGWEGMGGGTPDSQQPFGSL